MDSATFLLYWATRSKDDDVWNFIKSLFEPRVFHNFIVRESPHWEPFIDNCKLLEEYGRQFNIRVDYVELDDDEGDQTMHYYSVLLSGMFNQYFGATGSDVNVSDAKNSAAQHALELIKIHHNNYDMLSEKFASKKL